MDYYGDPQGCYIKRVDIIDGSGTVLVPTTTASITICSFGYPHNTRPNTCYNKLNINLSFEKTYTMKLRATNMKDEYILSPVITVSIANANCVLSNFQF